MKEVIKPTYMLGQIVKHKFLGFRGVIFDVDPEFNNSEEWYLSIPEDIRPKNTTTGTRAQHVSTQLLGI